MGRPMASIVVALTVYVVGCAIVFADPYAADRQDLAENAEQAVLINDPTSLPVATDQIDGRQTLSSRSSLAKDPHESLDVYGGR